MMHCEDSVQYTQISSIHVSDFTPSRITRPSSNHFLQEHCSIDELYHTVRPSPQLYRFLTQAREAERKLKGKYIQVVFAETYPGCPIHTSCKASCKAGPDTRPEMRPSSAIDRTANGTVTPLCIRSRTERRRTAFRKRSDTKLSTDSGWSSTSVGSEQETGCLPDVVGEMDVEPSVVVYPNPLGRTNGAMLSCSQFQPQNFEAATHTRTPANSRPLARPVPFQLPADNEDIYKDLSSPENSLSLHTRTSSTDPGLPPSVENSCRSSVTSSAPDGDSAIMSSEEHCSEELTEDAHPYDDIVSPNLPETKPITIPSSQHRPISRRAPLTASEQPPLSLPASTPPVPVPVSPNTNRRGYKPLPPPKAKSQGDIYENKSSSSSSTFTTKGVSKSTPDLPVNEGQQPRLRSVSFMNCSAGPEMGRFPADYLGSKQVDSYIGYADALAKELINSRPIEVMAYVTSEKLRLAPPKNASVLFKSFAMKDILSVQKCSKNRRIICVSVWKSRAAPQCHVLRCPTTLVSNALYDAILDQTQSVDDVSTDKISPPRPPSTASNDSCSSSGSVPPPPSAPEPQPPSEFLHKLPAIHIGSTKADRHDSVNDIIQKVLLESHPTAAKEISVWLSLAQLRLIDMSDEQEMIYEAHETSRIRAIGVFSVDKRFIGYIVKEEGKPLMGHVLRCNSAALMVSLVSFLRQACQIMFSQQGGSLYDELSTDESDTETVESPPSVGHGFIQRLKYIANPHKPLSPTASQPTFVSHTPPSQSPVSTPGRTADSSEDSIKSTLLSPLEIPEEDFVRFSVTYVGSAVVKLPFSSSSLTQALALFQEGGIAAGRAAVVKNVIQMHISALGINLIDKKHRLFVNRNYPRKQLAGYCRHPEDQKVFAFGSRRPGYPHEIKCHVFRQVQESADHVMEAIHHWLEMDPTSPRPQ